MSPLPCAVIGIICYLWSHNKACHGAFSVIMYLFVSSWAAASRARPGQAARAAQGRGRAAPMAARAGDVTPSQWGARQPAPPGAAAFPTDTGNGLFPSKPRAAHLPPDVLIDSRRKYSRALNQLSAAPHYGGSTFKRGYWFGAPSGSTLKALNSGEQTHPVLGERRLRQRPSVMSKENFPSSDSLPSVSGEPQVPVPFPARLLQALQHSAEPSEHREGLQGEAIMLHHRAKCLACQLRQGSEVAQIPRDIPAWCHSCPWVPGVARCSVHTKVLKGPYSALPISVPPRPTCTRKPCEWLHHRVKYIKYSPTVSSK